MGERRQAKRMPRAGIIGYSVTVLEFREPKNLSLKGEIIDISDIGMSIQTCYPLEPGHVLRFNEGIGHKVGIVVWGMHIKDNTYKVGIKFV